eukprot:645193-Rhodomonas_salina.1
MGKAITLLFSYNYNDNYNYNHNYNYNYNDMNYDDDICDDKDYNLLDNCDAFVDLDELSNLTPRSTTVSLRERTRVHVSQKLPPAILSVCVQWPGC